jgi:alkyldihydroxyacetonephosphate synthase
MSAPDEPRSHWAWGLASRLPDLAARTLLGEQVAGLLGAGPFAPLPEPSLDEARVREPRCPIPADLAAFATAERAVRARHTHGRSFPDQVRAFRGDFLNAPDLVAFPRDEAEVAVALAAAEREGLAVIPFGGGTSVVGGVAAPTGTAHRGVLSLDLRAMDRVIEVDREARAARIQAGATGPALERQLSDHGYTLRHYPQSFEFSTLGGWVATRAGGHFATLYTHIDDLVESVRVVTPRGLLATRRLPASGAGPAPERLILGSEGVLGVITEAWVRVQERPRYRESASVLFASFHAAVAATRAIAQAALFPSNCRLLDPTEALINLVADGSDSVLILAFESADHAPSARLDRALEIAISLGGRCPRGPVRRVDGGGRAAGDGSAEAWRQAFLDGPYRQSALITLGVVADTFETCCTWGAFPALHAALARSAREAFARCGARGTLSCRFTHVYPDGPAPYYTFVATPGDRDMLDTWAEIKGAVSDTLVAEGATITHHHSVGRVHRPWYEQERPPLFGAILAAAKQAVDPAGVLNPGVLIPEIER